MKSTKTYEEKITYILDKYYSKLTQQKREEVTNYFINDPTKNIAIKRLKSLISNYIFPKTIFPKEVTRFNNQYWICLGYSEAESIIMVSETQKQNANRFHKKRKETPENYIGWDQLSIEHWNNKGYSNEEANQKLLERKNKMGFSLEKCIIKYGEIEGRLKWQKRQDDWQVTLGKKEYIDIILMNFKKSTAFPSNVAYFLGIPVEDYSDELFMELIKTKEDYIKNILEKYTKEFSDYSSITRAFTNQNYNKYKHIIDPSDIRGNDNDLDHKYSVYFGFINNVSPEIIAHPCNLEILSTFNNGSKHTDCSIALDDLLEMISCFIEPTV